MNAAVVNVLGQPPRYQAFPEPDPGEGEVLIHVRAAGLHPIVKALASGTHYAAEGQVPMVPGVDGIGIRDDDGSRVFFGFARHPFGTMSERTVTAPARCMPVPEGLDDAIAAAIPNPGMSAWLSIKDRAALAPGETILINGATGVAGRMAIQIARHLGAKKIIGSGRNLDSLRDARVDATIQLDQPEDDLRKSLAAHVEEGIDVVLDYLWGRPAELILEAIAKSFRPDRARSIRMVEVGESAGKTITLPGATLRSVDLKLLGSGFGSVALDRILAAMPTLFGLAAKGDLTIDIERIPLRNVESAWTRKTEGRRIVFVP